MSYFPMCDFEAHPWLKKKHLVYVGVAYRGQAERWRLRFCPAHLGVLEEDLAQHEVSALQATVSNGDRRVVDCLSCREPIEEIGWQLFVTCYPTQDERKDYWARIHNKDCLPHYLKDPYQ